MAKKERYVDGYVIPMPKKAMNSYRRMAKKAGKVWRKHGALDYKECVGEDLKNKWGVSFSKLARIKKGETVVFSYITYKSRAHRDAVNAKVMKDPLMDMNSPENKDKPMPFNPKRMAFGGFRIIVDA